MNAARRERIGAQQLQILRHLANEPDQFTTTTELAAWSLTGAESGSGWHSALSSIRRSLALLRTLGLVQRNGYFAEAQGRPAIWQITRAGIDCLAQYNNGGSQWLDHNKTSIKRGDHEKSTQDRRNHSSGIRRTDHYHQPSDRREQANSSSSGSRSYSPGSTRP